MLLLVDTNDSLEVVTTQALAVDVVAAFIDRNGTTDTPGKQLTAISTATTTTVVSAPGASTVRNIKHLSIRNKGASPQGVTVQLDDNGTNYELISVTLQAGETLLHTEGAWFVYDSTGQVKSGAVNPMTVKVLSGDQSNSTTTLTEVTGLTLPNVGPGTYVALYFLRMQAAATTTGLRLSINHDGTVGFFMGEWTWPGGTAAASDAADQDFVAAGGQLRSGFFARAKSTTGWGTTLSVDTANADLHVQAVAVFEVTVAGNLELWHGSEVAAASTVKAGSSVVLIKTG